MEQSLLKDLEAKPDEVSRVGSNTTLKEALYEKPPVIDKDDDFDFEQIMEEIKEPSATEKLEQMMKKLGIDSEAQAQMRRDALKELEINPDAIRKPLKF